VQALLGGRYDSCITVLPNYAAWNMLFRSFLSVKVPASARQDLDHLTGFLTFLFYFDEGGQERFVEEVAHLIDAFDAQHHHLPAPHTRAHEREREYAGKSR